jgi:hypothetical protein
MVRRPVMQDMLMRLGVKQPDIDLFGEKGLHVCPKWYGPGSDVPDAMKETWRKGTLHWCNPPFSIMAAVVDKIIEDGIEVVLIMPHWPSEAYFRQIQKFVVRRYFYKTGLRVFETQEGPSGPTRWPVWALLVDAGKKTGELG